MDDSPPMPPGVADHPAIQAVALVLAGAVGLLLAGAVLLRLCQPRAGGVPGALSWLPVVIAAVVATLLGQSDLALGVVFGTSVAVMSAVAGFALLAGPAEAPSGRAGRVLAFLPLCAMLALVTGFRGMLGPVETALLLAQGVLSRLVWTTGNCADAVPAPAVPPQPPPRRRARLLWTLAALAVAVESAWAAARGAEALAAADVRYPPAVVGSAVLGVVLTAPLIAAAVPAGAVGQSHAVVVAGARTVMLNLGALLPAVVVLAMLRRLIIGGSEMVAALPWFAVPFPRIVWRIDAVMLLALAALFAAAAAGKVRLGRHLGMWLTAGYCVYLAMVLRLGAM